MTQQLANGLFSGAIYSLFAIGFTLVFGILRHLNLAHAAIFTGGAFLGIELAEETGLPIWVVFILVIVAGSLVGVLLEYTAFRPLAGRRDEHFAGLISSVAFGGMLLALLQARYGTEPAGFPSGAFPTDVYVIGDITVSFAQLTTLGAALVLMLGLAWMVARTGAGRAMRTVAENPQAARVVGINVTRVTAGTYALSSALGAMAGMLMALNVGQADRGMGLSIELMAFAVIILGGMGSLWGAMAAGIVLGLAEALTVQLLDSSWKEVVAFAVLFIILLVRPQGLFGTLKARVV